MNTMIRGTHPYGFRSGQWAELVRIMPYTPEGNRHTRDCFMVRFPEDGFVDLWVVADPDARYEFRETEQSK